MNDERMPINLYSIDYGEGEKELTEEEFKLQKKNECKPWHFFIGVCVVIGFVFAFMHINAPETLSFWMWGVIYLLVCCLAGFALLKIRRIKKVR